MDAVQAKFEREYDHFVMMGLLVCISEEDVVDRIVKTISNSLKKGGYFATRDTMTMFEEEILYYNQYRNSDFVVVYRPKEFYEKIFERNGFEIIQEKYFEVYRHHPVEHGVHGYILRKK